jgi:hypothetical protein
MPTTPLTIRLLAKHLPIHSAVDPQDAAQAALGLQDADGQVHPGETMADGGLRFACSIGVLTKGDGLDFRGSLVHGRPGERFVYLSWKRQTPSATPWVQRIKIPLAGLAGVWDAAHAAVEADITGRAPHDTRPIAWRVVK